MYKTNNMKIHNNNNSNNNNYSVSNSSNNSRDDDDEGLYDGPINEQETKDIKERKKHYSSSERSRSRSRSRGRSYSRSHSRSRSRSRSHSRSRSRSYSRSRSRDRYSRRDHYRRYKSSSSSSSKREEPTNIIMLKGLNNTINEERLSDFMKIYGAFESLSIKYDKVTGETRGFAFVNYKTVTEATAILRSSGGTLSIDGVKIYLSYGIPEVLYDWICETCNNSNFSWRTTCHKCQDKIPKDPKWVLNQLHHQQQQQQQQESLIPSNTLVIRELIHTATEETLALYFSQFARKPKRISVSRKKNNCIGFVEYYAINDAIDVYTQCHKKPIYIGGGIVSISYSKSNSDINSSKKDIIDPTTGLTKSDMDQWLNNYGNASATNIPSGFSYHAASGYYYNSETTYFYDPSGGVYFYFDNTSQAYFYYDSTTNSYLPFNANVKSTAATTTSTTTTTSSIEQSSTSIASKASSTTTADQSLANKDDKRKAVAQVSKFNSFLKKKNNTEIEKWKLKASLSEKELEEEAKIEQLFQQRERELESEQPPQQQTTPIEEEYDPFAPDISTAPVITKTETTTTPTTSIGSFSISQQPIKFSKPAAAIKVVSPVIIKKQNLFINDDADDDPQQQTIQEQHKSRIQQQQQQIQPPRIICKICDRMFISDEALFKHEKESKLHQSNLEKLRPKSHNNNFSSSSYTSSNNNSFGGGGLGNNNSGGNNNLLNKRKQDSTFGENSIGVKLLKKTGWKEGEGLGKNSDGMTAAIQVTMKTERSGLGSNIDPRYVIQPGDDYQTKLKKKNFQRFLAENGGSGLDESNPFFK